ncbi:MAG: response regulator transcription factor, partial [Actinobacteria bacterium]|nr:response regulator transcription factor [Actinomycetota bacterium]
ATIGVALAEAAWLRGDGPAAQAHLQRGLRSPVTRRFARPAAEVALWGSRLGLQVSPPEGAPEPVVLELGGDWRGAIAAWRRLGAPYEAALAALPADDRAAAEAVATLRRLGAEAAAGAFTRHRVALGRRSPRGPRRSTLANSAGLTRREQEVLVLLAGGATNPAIAESLHLSPRTVDHHVSAILAKLGAGNRTAAVEQGRRRGLLAET